jgi:myo-inositol-1(or 4)-monophosphatase
MPVSRLRPEPKALVDYDAGMPDFELGAELDVAIDSACRAGRIQMERYERLERIVHKSDHDVVTEVDHLSEELILDAIRQAFPADTFLAEESGRGGSSTTAPATSEQQAVERLWIVDPLDGTVNYANGIPIFCVSIALAVGGRPVLGVIHDPSRDETYVARAGGGARLDGVPIRYPAKEKLADAVVAMSLPPLRFARREARIRRTIRAGRNLGSASLTLAYVANGRFDAYLQAGGLSVWDVAAAGLIATEAGATVTDWSGGPWFDLARKPRSVGIVAAAPDHHSTFLEMLR